MFRAVTQRLGSAVVSQFRHNLQRSTLGAASVRFAHGRHESDAEFDARYEAYFDRPDIDGWEVRKAMNDLQGEDLIPEPKIVVAAMKACRRINDLALAVRYLEAVKDKCGPRAGEVWPYMMQEVGPTLEELGIPTPEQLGYDKPELAVQDMYEIH